MMGLNSVPLPHSGLDRNEYSHITATYFLLAERKLRSTRNQQPNSTNNSSTIIAARSGFGGLSLVRQNWACCDDFRIRIGLTRLDEIYYKQLGQTHLQ